MSSEASKPCPWCGARLPDIRMHTYAENGETMKNWIARCNDFYGCGAMLKSYPTKEEAVKAWNKRYE